MDLKERVGRALTERFLHTISIIRECTPHQAAARIAAEKAAKKYFDGMVLRDQAETELGQIPEGKHALEHFDYQIAKRLYTTHTGKKFPSFQQWKSPKAA